MAVLTVRMTDKEKADLDRRAKAAGVSTGGLVRQLISDTPFTTGADLLKYAQEHMGDQRLRVRRRK